MGLAVGLVGLPNVGKSTLFKALTRSKAEVGNYPFCTIDPNIGIVPVKDPRIDRLAELFQPDKVIYSTLQVVDIAGLVKGASQGEGLGNQFLSHIRQMDAIVHVVRCFDDSNVVHVDGDTDPIRDLDVIQTELILADLEQVERKLDRVSKQIKGNKALAAQIPVYEKMIAHLGEGLSARTLNLNAEEGEIFDDLNLLSRKPYLYIANVDEEGLQEVNDHQQKLREKAVQEQVEHVTICAQIESELSDMDEEEAESFMQEMGIERSGLAQLTTAGYRLLNQISYFTAGKKEVRAWNIPAGFLAPQAAGKIHTDFEKGFIRAEVYHFDEIDQLGSEAAIKDAGKLRLEGREYLVKDGDVMHFRFNV